MELPLKRKTPRWERGAMGSATVRDTSTRGVSQLMAWKMFSYSHALRPRARMLEPLPVEPLHCVIVITGKPLLKSLPTTGRRGNAQVADDILTRWEIADIDAQVGSHLRSLVVGVAFHSRTLAAVAGFSASSFWVRHSRTPSLSSLSASRKRRPTELHITLRNQPTGKRGLLDGHVGAEHQRYDRVAGLAEDRAAVGQLGNRLALDVG